MKGLLRIGDLARLGGVSIKALRFYDEQELLRPDYVDPQTGYRYYAIEQTHALAQITNLRAVDFSIQEIAALLSAEPTASEITDAIVDKKRILRCEKTILDNKLQLADILSAIITDTTPDNPVTLKLRTLEDQTFYAMKKTVAHLGAPVTKMFETAEAIVATRKARAPMAPFLLFHDPPTKPSDLTLEVCIPVDQSSEGLMGARRIHGGYGISTVYKGGYAHTAALYEIMTKRLERVGLAQSGPLHEIYHRFGADQEDYALPAKMLARRSGEYLTEVLIPISLPDKPKESF